MAAARDDNDRVVLLRDGMYYMCTIAGVHLETYTQSDLPDSYKRSIGMLKLVDDNTSVPGIGYRLDETAFRIKGETK